jgi:F0F1-type ATP synthase membrane subunit b/b'
MSLDPISQLNLVTIVGVVVLFVITLLILNRVFFAPLLGVMQSRDAKIEKGRQIRAEAERLIAEAQLLAEQVRTDSAAERERAVTAIRADIAASRDARVARAMAEGEAILAAGRDEVAKVRASEQAKMRDSLTACVVETLSSMLERVDERAVRAMVDRQLAQKAAEGQVT